MRLEHLDSEPEPDVMISADPDLEAFGTARMRALLVIEVAESSLPRDVGEKLALYASAEVPEYWVVNLVDRVLEVFRSPADGRYQQFSRLPASARVSPEVWPDLELLVSSLLPG